MVEMIPNLISPEIKSNAEANLFREFRDYKTNEKYIILHSLGIAEHVNNIFGEIDFVVICHKGVLCIEVKGGRVQCNHGIWEFTDRYGKINKKVEGPFKQAQGNMQSLRKYMMKRLGKKDPLVTCQYASCVIMPDCRLIGESPEIIPEILFDESNYMSLDQIVRDSFAYWAGKLRDRHGFEGSGLTDDEMNRLAVLLRGDFHFVPTLKDTVENTAKALCALTDEQYDILESLEDNRHTLVCGAAGTGKTLLAMEQARRIYESGKTVIYICYNRNVSGYVQYMFEKSGVKVVSRTLHSIMSENKIIEGTQEDYFEKILPEKFIRRNDIQKYDYLVVDEGQDLFKSTYIQCFDKLLKGGLKDGRWLMFYDKNQNLYNNSKDFDNSLDKLKNYGTACYRLRVNCRNTMEIASANILMTGFTDVGKARIPGNKVRYVPYKSKSEEHLLLENALHELKAGGVCGADLILLSKYSLNNPDNCLNDFYLAEDIGSLKTEGPIWRAKRDEVRFSTISSFKGLEATVLLLLDVDSFSEENARLLNYVAISRAVSLLYIFYDADKEEERQDMMVREFLVNDGGAV